MCDDCLNKDSCQLAGKKSISIPSKNNLEIYKEYLKESKSDEFIESYKKRKHIVEPVFGNIKNKGIKIWRKGKEKVEVWFSIACMAHNIEKLVNNNA